jgi:hypothetical protein
MRKRTPKNIALEIGHGIDMYTCSVVLSESTGMRKMRKLAAAAEAAMVCV